MLFKICFDKPCVNSRQHHCLLFSPLNCTVKKDSPNARFEITGVSYITKYFVTNQVNLEAGFTIHIIN